MTLSAAGSSAPRFCISRRIGAVPSASRVSNCAHNRVAASPSRFPCTMTMRRSSSRSYSDSGQPRGSNQIRAGAIAGFCAGLAGSG